jgi:hypothetical protein
VTTSLADLIDIQPDGRATPARRHLFCANGGGDADRPPTCPVCSRRLVILTSRSGRNGNGAYVRRQLWGCPRGHATAEYVDGAFGPVEVLPEG